MQQEGHPVASHQHQKKETHKNYLTLHHRNARQKEDPTDHSNPSHHTNNGKDAGNFEVEITELFPLEFGVSHALSSGPI